MVVNELYDHQVKTISEKALITGERSSRLRFRYVLALYDASSVTDGTRQSLNISS